MIPTFLLREPPFMEICFIKIRIKAHCSVMSPHSFSLMADSEEQ